MNTLRRVTLTLLLCLLLCVCLASAAYADGSTVQALKDAITNGEASFTLTGDMTISGETIKAYKTAVIVPAGKTLTMNGGTVELSTLRLTGGTVEIRGSSFRVSDKLDYQSGAIKVYNGFNVFPAADVLPDKTGIFSFPGNTGMTNLLMPVSNEGEFKTAVETTNNLPANFIGDVNVVADMTLYGRYAFTHLAELRMNGAPDSALHVEKGALVSNQQGGVSLFSSSLELRGELSAKSLTVDAGCALTVTGGGQAQTERLALGGTVALRDNYDFRVLWQVSREGGEIQIDGGYDAYLAANGMLGHEYEVVRFVGEKPSSCGILFVTHSNDEIAAALETAATLDKKFGASIQVDGYTWEPDGKVLVPDRTQIHINGQRGGSLHIPQGSEVQLNADLILEPGASGSIDGFIHGYGITVNEDSELVSAGTVDLSKLTLGGSVVLDGGIFRVDDRLNNYGGTVVFASPGFHLFPAADILPDNTGIFSFEDASATAILLFKTASEEDFAAAIDATNGLDDHFVSNIAMRSPITLSAEYVLTHKAEIRVNCGDGGALNLTKDASLRYDRCGGGMYFHNNGKAEVETVSEIAGTLYLNGVSIEPGCGLRTLPGAVVSAGEMRLDGALTNDGSLELRKRYNGSDPIMLVRGSYSGSGTIGVMDRVDADSYFSGLDLGLFTKIADNTGTRYWPVHIDLILPASLTAVGAEAFALDSFGSIYIPSGVTAIDPTAFDGISGLTIYCEAGSPAETLLGNLGLNVVALG